MRRPVSYRRSAFPERRDSGQRRVMVMSAMVCVALGDVLGDADVVVDFTVADILLTCVLRELRKNEILREYAHIENYRRRCEERPGSRWPVP